MNVIITGANRGIGLAILKKFASEGWNIWACVRKENPDFEKAILKIESDCGVWIKVICMDMLDETQIKSGMKKIFDSKEPIHALVNNAGIGYYALFQMTSIEKAREIFGVNFFAPFLIMQYVLRKMERQSFGTIVNISSQAATLVNAGDSVYGAAKAALNILTRDIAAEYGAKNIRVNAVAPGPTQTELLELTTSKVGSTIYDRIAMKRLAQTDEIANVVYFLASDEASFINGEIVTVNGGFC